MTAMRFVAVLAVAVLGVGCAASGLTIANGVGLGVSSGALACDWNQTRGAAEREWIERYPTEQGYGSRVMSERNPIIGPTPSTGRVDAYFAAALGLTVLAWRLTPRRYRWAVPAAVTAIQIAAITSNVVGGAQLPLCGIGG